MKAICFIAFGILFLSACTQTIKEDNPTKQSLPIVGTWKLLSGMTIEGKDTIFTDYTQDQEFIKIINESHFAFLRHDLKMGKDSNAIFVAGGGKYALKGNKYTEHLKYCNFREWENNTFEFDLLIDGDTLVTRGIEKVENLNVNRLNIEKYIRVEE